MIKPALSQLLAVAQLAEMHYNADQSEHKKATYEKAVAEYAEAAEAEKAEQPASHEPVANDSEAILKDRNVLASMVDELVEANTELVNKNRELTDENQALFNDKLALAEEKALLNNLLIEKDEKIKALENPALSEKSTAPETAPVVETTEAGKPLTPYQKGLLTRKANEAAAAAKANTDETKKNS